MKYELKDEMTAQEVFDYVSNHLLTQNRRSVQGGEACAYRGDEDGISCAVGCMIKNQEYFTSMEGLNVKQLIQRDNIDSNLKSRLTPHVELLTKLQVIHDLSTPSQWRHGLVNLANNENLIINF